MSIATFYPLTRKSSFVNGVIVALTWLLAGGVSPAPAADVKEVMMYGVPVRPTDYLGARIVAASGNTASLGMGALDGLREDDALWLFREINDVLQKIGEVVVFEVKERSSLVVATGGLQLEAADLAVIPAKDLDLFISRKRFDYRMRRRIVERQGKNSYDTRELETNGAELLITLRVDNALQYDSWRRRSFRIRPEGPAYYDITSLRAMANSTESRLQARKARPLTAAERIERLVIPETGEFIGFPLTIFMFQPESGEDRSDVIDEVLTDREELPLGFDPMRVYRPLRAYLRKHAGLSDPPPEDENPQG